MAIEFDELAKSLARGVSRRRALRRILGGIAGSVVGFLMTGGKASASGALPLTGPTWNRSNARLHQEQVRWNQLGTSSGATNPVFNQQIVTGPDQIRGPHFNQRRQP